MAKLNKDAQYTAAKAKYKDRILLFKLEQFYEIYGTVNINNTTMIPVAGQSIAVAECA